MKDEGNSVDHPQGIADIADHSDDDEAHNAKSRDLLNAF